MKKYFTQKESVAIGFIAIAFLVGEGVNFYRERAAKERLEKSLPLLESENRKFLETSSMLEARYEKENLGIEFYDNGSLKSLDINVVGLDGLTLLPGVGKVIAGRMLDRRIKIGPFENAEELLTIRGIGPKKFRNIQPYIIINDLTMMLKNQ